ncbi:MAG TPA: hypothetical protein VN914_01720 [Polyangia bacterium]|nr:hypothetical protein [Polyangia bacterium]
MASTGKGGSVKKSSAEEGLLSVASQLINESAPLRKEVLGQTLESMQTGGIGAQLPIVQKGIEASRAATASTLSGLDESLARSGLGRSSAAIANRANTTLTGELATQAIPQDVASQFIAIAPSLTMGFTGQGMQGLTGATGAANQRMGISAQRDIAKGNQQAEIMKSLMSSAAMAAAGCWVAEALFGAGSPKHLAAYRFLFVTWRGPVARAVRRTYVRNGARWARRWWMRWLLRPAFEVAAWRGAQRG